MTISECRQRFAEAPLIASVQADEGNPAANPEILLALAQSSLQVGVRMLRLQGVENIRRIRAATGAPTIGLIKSVYPDSEVYITPTSVEVRAVLEEGCEIVALDATMRHRPGGQRLPELIAMIHAEGRLAMADCDSAESGIYAVECGADLLGTTLAGYTEARRSSVGPDLELVRDLVELGRPVVAEGRYSERWHVETALRIGAAAVVAGGALNDPVKQTRALTPRRPEPGVKVGAVDIGGTWLRFAVFDSAWQMEKSERIPNPPTRSERLKWIRERAAESGVGKLGVSSGGVIDPRTGVCITAKEYLMPDQIGIEFSEDTLGLPTFAHGDGHATAWAHACLPAFAGRRVATLALGTGVGCGFVQDGRIWMGREGQYPRINDLPMPNGSTYESALGGLHLTKEPSEDQKKAAVEAFKGALFAIRNLYFPDDIIVAGSVGLADWLASEVEMEGVVRSPFGADAGLHGAAALALYPV